LHNFFFILTKKRQTHDRNPHLVRREASNSGSRDLPLPVRYWTKKPHGNKLNCGLRY